jgi:SAM-dependent methyltransferase
MHSVVFACFERICRQQAIKGRVLEIGARPRADTLLSLPSLAGASERLGLDLDGPHDWQGMRILAGNANRMAEFADGSFDVVLSNSMLEHDLHFWLTLGEIRRVLKPGGLVAIGVPGYGAMGEMPLRRPIGLFRFCPGLAAGANLLGASSVTLGLHPSPGDYYRFSEQAVREVLLGGYRDAGVERVLMPPRFIGWGRKPA